MTTPFEQTDTYATIKEMLVTQYGEIVAEMMLKGISPEALVHILPAKPKD